MNILISGGLGKKVKEVLKMLQSLLDMLPGLGLCVKLATEMVIAAGN
jgi:hypothetical protein